MQTSRPAYVFVGGVSHTPKFFEKVIEELKSQGIDSTAVAFSSCRDNTEGFKHWDEVVAIQNSVLDYLDRKKQDVVLVAHSYGGWPGSRAIKGLDKEARLKTGKTTGIVETVFIAAFLLPDNAVTANYSYLPPWLDVEVRYIQPQIKASKVADSNQHDCRRPNDLAKPLLFSDLEPADQDYWLSQCAWHKNDFSLEIIPDAPWDLSVRKTYIVCTEDKTATVEFQFKMLQGVINNTWTIKSINSGHEPFLSQPAKLAQILLQPSL